MIADKGPAYEKLNQAYYLLKEGKLVFVWIHFSKSDHPTWQSQMFPSQTNVTCGKNQILEGSPNIRDVTSYDSLPNWGKAFHSLQSKNEIISK